MLKITLLTAALALAATPALADVSIVDNGQKLTVDCAKDKQVNIVGNKAEVTLTGTCEQVNISGNKASVKGSVRQANISGNENTLALDAVDQIFVSGNKNTVSYKKPAKEKKTSTANTGSDNKITLGK
jgi:hypothetical protein